MNVDLLPPERGFTLTRDPELKLRHLPVLLVYLGCIFGISVMALLVAAIAFAVELVFAAGFVLIVTVVLLIVVPAGFLDTLKRNWGSATQSGRPDSKRRELK